MNGNATLKYLYFRDIVGMLKTVSDEVRLEFDESSIKCRCVDIANVFMICLDVPRSIFDIYNLESQTLCLNVSKLWAFANMSYGFVNITQIENGIKFTSGKYSIVMKQLDDDTVKKSPQEPNLKFSSKAIVKTSDMRKFLNNVKSYDKIKLHIQNGSSRFSVKDDEDNTLNFEIDNGCVSKGNTKCLYSLEYILDAFRYIKGEATINSCTDHPIKIEMSLNNVNVGYYLIAPRIEAE